MAIVNCTKIKPRKRVADRGTCYMDMLVGDLLDPDQCRDLELQEIKRMIYDSRLKSSGCRYLMLDASEFDALYSVISDLFDEFCIFYYGAKTVPRRASVAWFDLCFAILTRNEYGDSSDPLIAISLTPACISLLQDYLKLCIYHLTEHEYDDKLICSCEEILKALED